MLENKAAGHQISILTHLIQRDKLPRRSANAQENTTRPIAKHEVTAMVLLVMLAKLRKKMEKKKMIVMEKKKTKMKEKN